MTKMKKVLSALLAASMLLSFTACSTTSEGKPAVGPDTSWVAKSGTEVVTSGVYLESLVSGCMNVYNQLGTTEKMLEQPIGDVTAREYILTGAKDQMKNRLGLKAEFDRLGLTLAEQDMTDLATQADAMMQSYGTLYESNGVSKDSLIESMKVILYSNKVYDSYYGENGTTPVDPARLEKALSEEFLKLQVYPLPKMDAATGQPLTEDVLAGYKEMMDVSLKQITEGADMNEVILELETATATAEAQPHTHDTADAHDILVNLEQHNLEPEFIDQAKTLVMDKPQVLETTYYYYLVKRKDPLANKEEVEAMKPSLTSYVVQDEFQAMMTGWADALTIEYNDAALKKYTPDKIDLGM